MQARLQEDFELLTRQKHDEECNDVHYPPPKGGGLVTAQSY